MLRGLAPPLLVMLTRVRAVFAVGGLIRKTAMDPVPNGTASRLEASKYSCKRQICLIMWISNILPFGEMSSSAAVETLIPMAGTLREDTADPCKINETLFGV